MTLAGRHHANTQIPRASGIVDRPRLLEKLQLVPEHKITLITAPPGYGKTTLAAQFVHRSSHPVVWHTLDERQRDVPTLHAQSLSILSHIVPNIDKITPGYGYAPGELAALVADHLRSAPVEHLIYALDDAQYLAGSPAAETWLRTLVGLLPANCHMMLLSRILPDLPFAEMIARREILAIGQEELRLTPQEIRRLAKEMLGAPLSEPEALELAERLEGWPAGTVLALQPLPIDLERAMLNGGEGPEALFSALAGAMLSAQPPDLRDFLLASSTLIRLTPELCSHVLKLPNSAELLAEAQRRRLFLSRVSGGLIYHTLFRNFLQQELRAARPEQFLRLHTMAADWFEAQDRIDEAFHHYLEAGLPERARDIADRVALSYFIQGKVETLLTWGAILKQLDIRASRLLHTCARIHTDRYEYDLAVAELDAAEQGFRRRRDEVGLADVQLQRAMIHLQRGEYQQAAARAAALLSDEPESPKLRGQALRLFGFARVRLGELETGTKNLEEALWLHREDGDTYALTNLLLDLEFAYTRVGRFGDAAACLQELVALRRSVGGAGALALALNNLGYHYHQNGDYREAMSTFQEGLSVVARVSNRRAESYLLWSMGDLQRDRGAFEEAAQLYDKALELNGSSEPSLRTTILISFSTLRRWQGKLYEAGLLAEEAHALAVAHNISLEMNNAQAAIWAVRSQTGQAEEAIVQLNRIADDVQKQGAHNELMHTLSLIAHNALLRSDDAAARRALESVVRIAREGGSMQSFIAEVIHTALLFTFIRNDDRLYTALAGPLKKLSEAQLKRDRVMVGRNRMQVDDFTYSLRVLTLGQENIQRDGMPILPSEWRASSARELFYYLLFIGPRDRDIISLDFWPESASRRVRSSFHTTLYRARQALGENAIVFQDGLYRINPDLDVWCDAQEFEDLVHRARYMPSRDARTEDLWRRAVDLYQGDFLLSLDTDWILSRREALRESYLDALTGLGECTRIRGDHREAIGMFRRALQVDPYREDIHRMIMICYAEKGEKNRIPAYLRELQGFLQDELAVDPSPETRALAQSLMD
jgi:LuxR family transcriptional regulator, maltose regulon positive regulatory protein